MGSKGFRKGHIVSKETKEKISKANDGNFFGVWDYYSKEYTPDELNSAIDDIDDIQF